MEPNHDIGFLFQYFLLRNTSINIDTFTFKDKDFYKKFQNLLQQNQDNNFMQLIKYYNSNPFSDHLEAILLAVTIKSSPWSSRPRT